jgi:hypothetical protein
VAGRRVLVVGSGGREHALAARLAVDDGVAELVMAPGNPGMAALGRCIDVPVDDVDGLVAVARAEGVDLVVVGPEVPARRWARRRAGGCGHRRVRSARGRGPAGGIEGVREGRDGCGRSADGRMGRDVVA